MKTYKFIAFLLLILFVAISFPQGADTLETDPVNITAMAVINRYIEAIGGKEKFAGIEDRITTINGTAIGKNISILIKQKSPSKFYQEITAGEAKQEMYFDGEHGMMTLADSKVEIEGKELDRLKVESTMKLLLDPESYGVKTELLPNEMVDSVNCHTVKLTLPSGLRTFQYYAMDTGLKIKELKEIQTPQGLFEQEIYYSDYKGVDGIKFPFTIRQIFGIQELDLLVDSIELNTGIDDKEFQLP
jgi:zinc protease